MPDNNVYEDADMKYARSIAKLFLGTRDARRTRRQSMAQMRQPEAGIKHLFAPQDAEGSAFEETPIFVLSAGWRSGSTLLQRLVCSGKDVLIWGEPYDRSNLIQTLARSAAPFSESWPPEGYIKPSEDLDALSHQWTANLYPPASALRAAYRAFMIDLFAKPASELGAVRWGLKEVRFGYAEAAFLKSLFPNARFLFIRRRLPDAYLSYKGFNGSMNWFADWPDKAVFTPFAFARHWARLRRETEQAAQDTGGILIEYEALVAGQVDIQQLSDYCDIAIDDSILSNRVGSGKKEKAGPKLTGLERLLLSCGTAFERCWPATGPVRLTAPKRAGSSDMEQRNP